MVELGWLARLLRWISNLLWPGDYDRDSAKKAFVSYLASKDVAKLDAAMMRFQLAVDQYRKHETSSLATTLINQSVVVWKHYEDCGRSPDDLDKVIRLNTEARDSWSGERNTMSYLFLLNALARACFEQYQRAFDPRPIKPEEKQRAFDEAVKYYTELICSPAAIGNQRNAAQIQLGIMFRTRCELEQTLDCFEIGVQHLQDALTEVTEEGKKIEAGGGGDNAKRGKEAALDDIKATCFLNLAEAYELRYTLAKDPRNIHDLTMAIDSYTRATSLLEALHRSELPACMFNLARQLWLRYWRTRDQNDSDAAQRMAMAAKKNQRLDADLGRRIDDFLKAIRLDKTE